MAAAAADSGEEDDEGGVAVRKESFTGFVVGGVWGESDTGPGSFCPRVGADLGPCFPGPAASRSLSAPAPEPAIARMFLRDFDRVTSLNMVTVMGDHPNATFARVEGSRAFGEEREGEGVGAPIQL